MNKEPADGNEKKIYSKNIPTFCLLCVRSWQFLYFPARVVKYIRVVGTHNTVNKVFHVVTLEALYTMVVYQLDLGLIVPTSNVATLDHSALVIEGEQTDGSSWSKALIQNLFVFVLFKIFK